MKYLGDEVRALRKEVSALKKAAYRRSVWWGILMVFPCMSVLGICSISST